MNNLLGLNGLFGINDLLFQILIVIFPISVYQLFWIEKGEIAESKKGKIISFIFYATTIALCMLFPIHSDYEHRFDLRVIPLTIGYLYLGHKAGILLFAWVLLLRILFGGHFGILHAVINMSLYFPVLFLVSTTYQHSSRIKRLKLYLLLKLYYLFCFLISSVFDDFILVDAEAISVFVTFVVIILTTSLVIISFIESVQEKLRMKEELQNSEKMRLLSDLTGIFAHEIRNPMQVTRGFLQLLNESNLPDSNKGYIKISIEELDRANMIINDFLTFAKPTTGESKEVDIKSELLRVANITHTFSNTQNVDIETNLTDNCWVLANPQRLDQCFINILKNAIESMPNGGQINVSCAPTKHGYIEIKFTDQGIGMTKEQIENLGTPFYSLKKNGTGLGMMITFQIIRSYNGKIKIKSQLEKGTTVSILLPRLDKATSNLNTSATHQGNRTLSDDPEP
ncbi:hypothetical protein BEP19_11375 [Ammoniphilus oxalaticus]|uniref:histidine kinase n=1 Tax=Ammoniphilus oxalaticus TaxID=66863 RepID=A0A419SGC4_9BACL|nr:ATP-binding protein [Ammoniphilus oxalaticus]RKD22836.1 hypothetical protein BEP19_11375 [Ammoniphilus oxalaticus]